MLKILSSVQGFIKDSWESHMICFIITGILLIIPNSWFIPAVGYSIPNYLKLVILILFILSSISICFDLMLCNSKKQLEKYNYRTKLIKEWRAFVEQFTFKNYEFSNTVVYSEMKSHLSEKMGKELDPVKVGEKPTLRLRSSVGGDTLKKRLLDEIAAIEKKWDLL